MLKLITFFFIFTFSIFAVETDFDCIVVGTSPTSLFEAIYQTSLGKRVVVVEKSSECGGAWKSIEICGIPHSDMGCHEFGHTAELKKFLEEYAGCKIIPNAPQQQKRQENWGFYPSKGCYELIDHLEFLMYKLGTQLLLNSKLESVFFDLDRKVAQVTINGSRYVTSKIVVTNGAEFQIENPNLHIVNQKHPKHTYSHIYLLIKDPTPSRFTYINMNAEGASRAMNLTQFVGLEGSGTQLIAIQVSNEKYFNSGEAFLNHFKKSSLVDNKAEIIKIDHYVYEQSASNYNQLAASTGAILEFLPTGHISLIGNYISKWKQAMRPWNEMVTRDY